MMMGASPGLWTERNLRAVKLMGEGLPPDSKPGSLRVEQHVFPCNPEEMAEPTSDSAFLFSDSSRASGGDAMCREPHHWGRGSGSLSKSASFTSVRTELESPAPAQLMHKPVAWGGGGTESGRSRESWLQPQSPPTSFCFVGGPCLKVVRQTVIGEPPQVLLWLPVYGHMGMGIFAHACAPKHTHTQLLIK